MWRDIASANAGSTSMKTVAIERTNSASAGGSSAAPFPFASTTPSAPSSNRESSLMPGTYFRARAAEMGASANAGVARSRYPPPAPRPRGRGVLCGGWDGGAGWAALVAGVLCGVYGNGGIEDEERVCALLVLPRDPAASYV